MRLRNLAMFLREENKMGLLNTILQRRSVRKYTAEAIADETLERILQAGLLAPTSKDRKPCEFYVIREKGILKELSEVKKAGGGFLAECDVAIAVFGDSAKADTWIEDCSIAMAYMNLMAAEEAVGSCWCQIHLRSSAYGTDAEQEVRKILSVPETYRIVGILALGIAAKETQAHVLSEADFSKVHRV